jgi:MFS family permease
MNNFFRIFREGKSVNRVVLLLTITDICTWGGYHLVASLAGVYLADKLGLDVAKVIGIGTGVFFFARSAFQYPIGKMTDALKSDRDEIFLLLLSGFVMGIPYMLFPIITNEYLYYLLQFFIGFGISLNVNAWRKMFALNLEKNHEGRDYAFYETVMSASTALLIVIAGLVANMGKIYFDFVMVGVGIMVIIGGFVGSLLKHVGERKSAKLGSDSLDE